MIQFNWTVTLAHVSSFPFPSPPPRVPCLLILLRIRSSKNWYISFFLHIVKVFGFLPKRKTGSVEKLDEVVLLCLIFSAFLKWTSHCVSHRLANWWHFAQSRLESSKNAGWYYKLHTILRARMENILKIKFLPILAGTMMKMTQKKTPAKMANKAIFWKDERNISSEIAQPAVAPETPAKCTMG